MVTTSDAKTAARVLRRELQAREVEISHGAALEVVARQLGHRDWNTASGSLASDDDQLGAPVPLLRVQSAATALKFYVDYLGFAVEWEHRFADDLPLYVRLRRGDAELDLSEHHGDGTPGSVVWIPIRDAVALRDELHARPGAPLRPGIDHDAPGGPTLEVIDPFGNVLRLCQQN